MLCLGTGLKEITILLRSTLGHLLQHGMLMTGQASEREGEIKMETDG